MAALLLSLQLKWGMRPDPHLVRSMILEGTDPCDPADTEDCRLYMVGILNPSRSMTLLRENQMSVQDDAVVTSCACQQDQPLEITKPEVSSSSSEEIEPSNTEHIAAQGAANHSGLSAGRSSSSRASQSSTSQRGVVASSYPGPGQRLVFAIGQIGFDFGTEARRDTFKQQMQPPFGPALLGPDPGNEVIFPKDAKERGEKLGEGYRPIPVNPYSPQQLVAYLKVRPDDVRSLIWTLNLELTPVYVIESTGPYGERVDNLLVQMLGGQSLPRDSSDYTERSSIPALLTDRTVRLFSGQVLPVIEVDGTRGMFEWKTADIVKAAVDASRSRDRACLTLQTCGTKSRGHSVRF